MGRRSRCVSPGKAIACLYGRKAGPLSGFTYQTCRRSFLSLQDFPNCFFQDSPHPPQTRNRDANNFLTPISRDSYKCYVCSFSWLYESHLHLSVFCYPLKFGWVWVGIFLGSWKNLYPNHHNDPKWSFADKFQMVAIISCKSGGCWQKDCHYVVGAFRRATSRI